MTAKDIQLAIDRYYCNGVRYVAPNIYFFGNGYHETDMLIVKESNMFVYDIEIKISRADFRADFQKTAKHMILEHGIRKSTQGRAVFDPEIGMSKTKWTTTDVEATDRPNRFYYAVPENLIKIEEVPKYAGLFYVCESGEVKKVKEAPLLHKNSLPDIEKRLCRKFYYGYRENQMHRRESGLQDLKNQVSKLNKTNLDNIDTISSLRTDKIVMSQQIRDLENELRMLKNHNKT